MLEPDRRELLLDALRPPAGYRLDIAVGTTYTLDLQALLLAPLAFAFFESASAEGDQTAGSDPIALLAALRDAAERMHIFCQAGRIGVPREYRRVMALVEGAVHAVTAPTPGGIFHPKVWTLRFAAPHAPPRYRLVSLSRNLTFDRSWDTLVRLEGIVTDSGETSAALAAFVRALPELAVRPLHPHAQSDVEALADELGTVAWEAPQPFHSVRLHPLGLGGSTMPFASRTDRLLAISPFLGPGALAQLAPKAQERILVSRPESLDALGSDALAAYTQTYVLAAPAEGNEPEDAQGIGVAGGETPVALSGLHAKAYVCDAGRQARVLTGSANATDAALHGNVEFLVELEGPKKQCGVDAVMKPGLGQAGFGDLLERYEVRHPEPLEPDDHELLQLDLERYATALAAEEFRAHVESEAGPDVYSLTLRGEASIAEGARVRVRPLTTKAASAVPLENTAEGTLARFEDVSFHAITSFFVLDLTLTRGALSESTAFVVDAELIGAPDDRLSRLLTIELGTRRSVVRYLLLLLAIGGVDADSALELAAARERTGAEDGSGGIGLPLLESLVRALSDAPDKLDAIDRLIVDLERSAEGRRLLPDDFINIWEAFRTVRREALS